ncbi:MAG: phosphotransferase family protein [Myxococcota bacterium]
MPTPWKRDHEEARRSLARWIAGKIPAARDLRLSELEEPQTSGFSNETLLLTIDYQLGGEARSEDLVVRVQPTGFQVFPSYDMSVQYRAMELLGPTDVPVPAVRWLETEDLDVLGAPFYVMERVEGRVPSDNPPYHAGGWMTEASPEERRRIWLGGFDCMARIHRLDPVETGFGFLDQPEWGDTPLDRQLNQYKRYLEWAARGRPQPTVETALAWLEKEKPAEDRSGIQWGDARIGNILFADGGEPRAVLDWEMVTLGSPEADVAWAIFLDRHHSEGLGLPRLEGFPPYDETIAYYEERSGHTVRHLDYYQVFAGFRFAVIMSRIAQQLVHYEVMDEAAGLEFETNNTVTRLLASLLDLKPPGEKSGGAGEY